MTAETSGSITTESASGLLSEIHVSANCSLTPRGAVVFFTGVLIASFSVAGYFAWHGFWPILPFAGLEMLVLGWVLGISMRRGRRLEVVTVYGDRIEIRHGDGGPSERMVFPRHWAGVHLEKGRFRGHPSRLTISCHGRSCEVGALLVESERKSLYGRLKELVGRAGVTPDAPAVTAGNPDHPGNELQKGSWD